MQMVDFILDNKEWIFSGLGIFIAQAIFFLLKWRKRKREPNPLIMTTGVVKNSNLVAGNHNVINQKSRSKKSQN